MGSGYYAHSKLCMTAYNLRLFGWSYGGTKNEGKGDRGKLIQTSSMLESNGGV